MPPQSRQGSNMTMGQKANEHKESREGSKEDGPNNNTHKNSGLLSRMTQVFDFKPRQSSNRRAEAAEGSLVPRQPSGPKRLMWGLKKSTPDLRKSSRQGTFEPVPEMPTASQRPENAFGRFTPPLESHLHIPKNRTFRAPTRIPKNVASTVAKVDFSVGARNIQQNQDMETWVTVTVHADVHNVGEAIAASTGRVDVPLDVLILVDTTDAATAEFLKGACKNVFNVATSLDTLVDRIAIGSVSSDPTHCLELLMPLGPCNFESISTTFYSLPSLQFPNMEAAGSRLSDALREASGWLLRQSSRGSLRQIFVLTPQSDIPIRDGIRPEMLRLHTISPAPSVGIDSSTVFYGWHIRASFNENAHRDEELELQRNLKQLVGYLRLGMEPGALSNLVVDLKTAPGTEVKACFNDLMRRRLRPGESWSMLFQIVTSASARVGEVIKSVNTESYVGGRNRQDVDVEEIIDDIQGMLGQQNASFESTLTATIDYGHSAFPTNTALKTTAKFDIPMIPPTETYEDEVAETAQQVGGFGQFADDSGIHGSVLRQRTGRGGYHTVKTKKGCFFSHNVDADAAQEAYEQEQRDKQAEIEAAYTFGPEMEMANETMAASESSRERTGLQTMNPYRALIAKASDLSLRKVSSKGMRRH